MPNANTARGGYHGIQSRRSTKREILTECAVEWALLDATDSDASAALERLLDAAASFAKEDPRWNQ